MRKHVLTAALAFTVPSSYCLANSLCNSDEVIYFSCPIAGSKKVLSICGGELGGTEEMWLQYRFGEPNKVELVFPSTKDNSYRRFKGESHRPFRGRIDAVSFENKGVTYTVESSASYETDHYFEGVRVLKNSESVVSLECGAQSPTADKFRQLASELFGY